MLPTTNAARVLALLTTIAVLPCGAQTTRRPPVAQARPVADGWTVRQSQSEMTDQPTVVLSTVATNTVEGWLARSRPTLVVRCKEGAFDVYLRTGMPSSVEREVGEHTVRYRVGDREAVTESDWSASTDDGALFSPEPHALFERLTTAASLLVEWTPFHALPVRARFDVAGLGAHRAALAAACPAEFSPSAGGADQLRPDAGAGTSSIAGLATLLAADSTYFVAAESVALSGARWIVPATACSFLLVERRDATSGLDVQLDSVVVDLRRAAGAPAAKAVGESSAWSATLRVQGGAAPWTIRRHNGGEPALTILATFVELVFDEREGAKRAAALLADAITGCRRYRAG